MIDVFNVQDWYVEDQASICIEVDDFVEMVQGMLEVCNDCNYRNHGTETLEKLFNNNVDDN